MKYLFIVRDSNDGLKHLQSILLPDIQIEIACISNLIIRANENCISGYVVDDTTGITLNTNIGEYTIYSLVDNPLSCELKILEILGCKFNIDLSRFRNNLNTFTISKHQNSLENINYPKVLRTANDVFLVNDKETAKTICKLSVDQVSGEDFIDHHYTIKSLFIFNQLIGSYKVEKSQGENNFKTKSSSTKIIYNVMSDIEREVNSIISAGSKVPLLETNHTLVNGKFVLFNYTFLPNVLDYNSLGFNVSQRFFEFLSPDKAPVSIDQLGCSSPQEQPKLQIEPIESEIADELLTIPESINIYNLGNIKLHKGEDDFICSPDIIFREKTAKVLLGESYFYLDIDEDKKVKLMSNGFSFSASLIEDKSKECSINLSEKNINGINKVTV